jgi:SAM-dependent methyltransferase
VNRRLGAGRSPQVRDVTVDGDGVRARARREVILDLHVDGRRVWSFWLHRDGTPVPGARGLRQVEWPKTLRGFLDGTARMSVHVHDDDGPALFDDDVALGSGQGPIEIATPDGRPITLDRSLRRVVAFEAKSATEVEPLMHAIGEVLGILAEAGVHAFLAYGTLLGAVRNGALIGHDADADLGYVSDHDHPVDVARESFRLQRALTDRGHTVTRYSTAAFKVEVAESDGTVRGLDVFGGFMREGLLHLMGEIIEPFRREWVLPLGEATLEGHRFPVPADTDRFLTITYGPSWRVPDPAFHFTTPRSTHRRFNGWFRGIRVGRALWDRRYASRPGPAEKPTGLARFVARRESEPAEVVDLGCGTGGDALFFARRGVPTVGLDLVPKGYATAAEVAEREGLPVRFLELNLVSLRSTLATAALLAAEPRPRVLLARHLLDALGTPGRHELFRLARLLLADGGTLYLEFLARDPSGRYGRKHKVRPRRPALVARELEASGATIVAQRVLTRRRSSRRGAGRTRICRMVVRWES